MKFYEALSMVYDKVFPYNENVVKFIENKADKNDILVDLACGSGSYDIELCKRGYLVQGIDLDKSMIDIAAKKYESKNLKFTCDDMSKVEKYYDKDTVGTIICIGNSLVHLNSKEDIENFILKCYEVLKPKGKLIVQIINYDNVVKNNVKSLPLIENEDIKFIRNYEYDIDKEIINFNTELSINNDVYVNSIPLKPIFKNELEQILNKIKFNKIDFFGDFKGSQYKEDSYALVLCAEK